MLFIHATLGSAASWTRVQAPLLSKLAMTAFDRPSHGESAQWTGDGGPAGLHLLTTTIAAGLIEGRADIVGHSYGATIALQARARSAAPGPLAHPGRAAALQPCARHPRLGGPRRGDGRVRRGAVGR
ncbi:MAG: alpha/beta fold hydrolase [Paracoccaceae bacterium]